MPKHKHHSHKKPSDLQCLSIFNNITVTTPVIQEQVQKDKKQEDGCASCFTALINCFKSAKP